VVLNASSAVRCPATSPMPGSPSRRRPLSDRRSPVSIRPDPVRSASPGIPSGYWEVTATSLPASRQSKMGCTIGRYRGASPRNRLLAQCRGTACAHLQCISATLTASKIGHGVLCLAAA
jgi:hypothetical protein